MHLDENALYPMGEYLNQDPFFLKFCVFLNKMQ